MTCMSMTRTLKIAVYTTLLPAPLAGCVGSIYPGHIKQAEEVCKEHGGWTEIIVSPFTRNGRCVDGKFFEVSAIK